MGWVKILPGGRQELSSLGAERLLGMLEVHFVGGSVEAERDEMGAR